MSNDALLYTMTTVAESLGGIVAVLAAFAVFRLQSLAGLIHSDLERIAETMPTHPPGPEGQRKKERLILLAHSSDAKRFLPLMDAWRMEAGDSAIDATTRGRMDRLHASHRRYVQTFLALCISLVVTALVMTGALAALASADHLQRGTRLGVVAPWLGVGGFILCLLSYLRLITMTLKRVG